MKPVDSEKRAGHRRRWRGLILRLAAVILGLMPFVLAEVALRVLDWGRPAYGDDPFVGFSAIHPLFVLSDDRTRYEIPRSRQVFFCPESFAAHKDPKEFRIFCLGGSTVQGRPFAIETSFTAWLEFNLQAADPSRRWDAINCGGVSYASYRLVPILEEVLGHGADLIILYTGHNEFLEDRTYGHIKYLPPIVARAWERVAQMRSYTLLRRAYVRLAGPPPKPPEDRPVLGPETDAMLEYRGGLQQYHRDEKWRRDVIEHFHYNLLRMVEMARKANVPLLLVNPVCNLRDCPPFKAQHRDGLTDDELRRWKALCAEAGEHQRSNLHRSVTLLQQAMAIDDRHAGLHYLLAKCYDASGEVEKARECYLQAKELDVCPLRILEPMNRAVLEVARRTATPLLDVRKMFESSSDVGIPGSYYLIDHVHPSIAGHRLIADALTGELARQGIVRPAPNWKEGLERKAKDHLDSLGDLYFAKGIERLEALRGWAHGKGDRVRPKSGPRGNSTP